MRENPPQTPPAAETVDEYLMVELRLSDIQKRALTALVTAHRRSGEPVNADEIASTVDREPGSVRSVMRGLGDLSLVTATTGPTGGYEPTSEAVELVAGGPDDDRATLTVASGFRRRDRTVERIAFTGVHHPDECRAVFDLRRSVHEFDPGDAVAVGPTPVGDLVVDGEVVATDETNDRLVVDVAVVETAATA